MARDSQAALVALNRFGLGARGGASGDFVNAASDPRGFVKAELSRPNGVLLEVPGLLSTPALGKAVFDYQFEIQQARDAAAKMPASEASPMQPADDAKAQQAKSFAEQHRPGHGSGGKGTGDAAAGGSGADAVMAAPDAMQPNAAKTAAAAAQHHSEDLPRRGAGAAAARDAGRMRFRRAAGDVLVQSFLRFREQGRAGADVGGIVRARGDPAACARPFRRHAARGRAASGDAVFSRQPAIARPGTPAPA